MTHQRTKTDPTIREILVMDYRPAIPLDYAQIDAITKRSADIFHEMYLDWLNNFATLEGYARYYGITREAAARKIAIGCNIHEQRINAARGV